MLLSRRVKDLSPSSTLRITALANKLRQEGQDVVSFGAGEPDMDTPEAVKEAAISAIKNGFTKYTPSTGTPELKKAIQEKFKKENNLSYASEQIVVSSGAKHCLFNLIFALIDEGDEVLIPLPYWVSYPEMVRAAGGVIRLLPAGQENNYKITAADMRKALSARTKLLILNSPSNPSGVVYSRGELQEIAAFCQENKIYVISDEIYEKLVYGDARHVSIASLNEGIYRLSFTVNGLSKAYSMTGWRVGYCAGPQEVMEAVKNLQDHSTSNPCSISQKAALAALNMPGDWSDRMRLEFQSRRNYLLERIKAIPSLNYIRPEGAFYLFCNIAKTGLGSQEFAMRLLNEARVAVVPGDGFGCDDYIRFSFALNIETIKKGIDRLEIWLRQSLKKS